MRSWRHRGPTPCSRWRSHASMVFRRHSRMMARKGRQLLERHFWRSRRTMPSPRPEPSPRRRSRRRAIEHPPDGSIFPVSEADETTVGMTSSPSRFTEGIRVYHHTIRQMGINQAHSMGQKAGADRDEQVNAASLPARCLRPALPQVLRGAGGKAAHTARDMPGRRSKKAPRVRQDPCRVRRIGREESAQQPSRWRATGSTPPYRHRRLPRRRAAHSRSYGVGCRHGDSLKRLMWLRWPSVGHVHLRWIEGPRDRAPALPSALACPCPDQVIGGCPLAMSRER